MEYVIFKYTRLLTSKAIGWCYLLSNKFAIKRKSDKKWFEASWAHKTKKKPFFDKKSGFFDF